MTKEKVDFELLMAESALYDSPETEKQGDILRAAEKLFAANGFAESSTASIAKAAGVTERTLFKHFPTKQLLFRRILFPLLIRTVLPFQMQNVRKLITTDYVSFEAMLRAIATDRWTEVRRLGSRVKIVVGELIQDDNIRNRIVQIFAENVFDLVADKVRYFQSRGDLRKDLPAEQIAKHAIMMVFGHALARSVVFPNRKFDDQADLEAMLAILIDGVKAKGT